MILSVSSSCYKKIANKTNVKENIQQICSNYKDDIIYYKFNQGLHKSRNTTDKHCNILNFTIKNLSQYFKNDFDFMCLFDADMCFIEDFDVKEELSGYDIVAPKRIQCQKWKALKKELDISD